MASAMQRSMSYRKPVPEYIPSPPSSPLHESDPVAQEPEKDLPPLPQNWREVVAAKIMQASSDTTHTSLSSSQNPLYVGIEKPYVVKHESHSHLPSSNLRDDHDSLNTLQNSQISQHHVHRGRGLPTNYRPPTPPLRSHSKQSRHILVSNDRPIDSSTLYSQPNSSNYPTSPSSSRLYLHSIRVGGRAASLRPSPSFRTEMTMVSMNTNVSVGWSHGLAGGSEAGMYSHPTLLTQKRDPGVDSTMSNREAPQRYSCAGGSIFGGRWTRWKSGMGRWAKKLRRAMATPK